MKILLARMRLAFGAGLLAAAIAQTAAVTEGAEVDSGLLNNRPDWQRDLWIIESFALHDARSRGTNLVEWIVIPEGSGYAVRHEIDLAGNAVGSRFSYASLAQGTHGRQLTPAELREAIAATAQLPPGVTPRAPHQTLIVRTREKGVRVMRFYDVDSVPESLQTLRRIVGKREDEIPMSVRYPDKKRSGGGGAAPERQGR